VAQHKRALPQRHLQHAEVYCAVGALHPLAVDKRGYPAPASEWLSHDNGRLLREVLVDRSSMLQQYFKPHALEKLVDRHVAGRFGVGDQKYGLLSTELWLNRCVAPVA
jgi:hypothetical protein